MDLLFGPIRVEVGHRTVDRFRDRRHFARGPLVAVVEMDEEVLRGDGAPLQLRVREGFLRLYRQRQKNGGGKRTIRAVQFSPTFF